MNSLKRKRKPRITNRLGESLHPGVPLICVTSNYAEKQKIIEYRSRVYVFYLDQMLSMESFYPTKSQLCDKNVF